MTVSIVSLTWMLILGTAKLKTVRFFAVSIEIPILLIEFGSSKICGPLDSN